MEKVQFLNETDQSRIVNETEIISGSENAAIPKISLTEPGAENIGIPLEDGNVAGSNRVSVGGLIDGKMATELMDSVLPALLVFTLAKGGITVRKTELQLSASEKSTLAPLMQNCLNAMSVNVDNPFIALGFSMAVIYGGKIIEKGGVAFLDKKAAQVTEKKPIEKVREVIKKTEINNISEGTAFTPENLERTKNQRKVTLEKAVEVLQKQYLRGKVDKYGNEIKSK